MSSSTPTLPVPPRKPTSDLAEVREQLERIERMLQRVVTRPVGDVLTTEQAMRRLGYTDADAFRDAVHEQGIPYVRMNKRRWMFEAIALDAWIAERRIDPRAIRRGRRTAA